jgi:hypothetical protein
MVNEKQLLQALQDRVTFTVAKRLLALNAYPVGISWEAIRGKLAEADRAGRDLEGLLKGYTESLVSHDKSVRAYIVDAKAMQNLRDDAREHAFDPDNPFVASYPFPLPQAQLSSASLTEPTPVAYERVEGASVLVFAAVRELELREPLAPSQLSESIAGRYDRVVGLRVERHQTFDAIVVPDRGDTVYVLIDARYNTTAETRQLAHFTTRNAANQFIDSNLLGEPIKSFRS